MIQEVLRTEQDPGRRQEILEDELNRLLERVPDHTEQDAINNEWVRQVERAIQDQYYALNAERESTKMATAFAKSMSLTPPPGEEGGAPTAAAAAAAASSSSSPPGRRSAMAKGRSSGGSGSGSGSGSGGGGGSSSSAKMPMHSSGNPEDARMQSVSPPRRRRVIFKDSPDGSPTNRPRRKRSAPRSGNSSSGGGGSSGGGSSGGGGASSSSTGGWIGSVMPQATGFTGRPITDVGAAMSPFAGPLGTGPVPGVPFGVPPRTALGGGGVSTGPGVPQAAHFIGGYPVIPVMPQATSFIGRPATGGPLRTGPVPGVPFGVPPRTALGGGGGGGVSTGPVAPQATHFIGGHPVVPVIPQAASFIGRPVTGIPLRTGPVPGVPFGVPSRTALHARPAAGDAGGSGPGTAAGMSPAASTGGIPPPPPSSRSSPRISPIAGIFRKGSGRDSGSAATRSSPPTTTAITATTAHAASAAAAAAAAPARPSMSSSPPFTIPAHRPSSTRPSSNRGSAPDLQSASSGGTSVGRTVDAMEVVGRPSDQRAGSNSSTEEEGDDHRARTVWRAPPPSGGRRANTRSPDA
jgi:hypothetical protein